MAFWEDFTEFMAHRHYARNTFILPGLNQNVAERSTRPQLQAQNRNRTSRATFWKVAQSRTFPIRSRFLAAPISRIRF